jgi:hypothetical protein
MYYFKDSTMTGEIVVCVSTSLHNELLIHVFNLMMHR